MWSLIRIEWKTKGWQLSFSVDCTISQHYACTVLQNCFSLLHGDENLLGIMQMKSVDYRSYKVIFIY